MLRSSHSSPNLNVICGECRCSLLRACFAAPSQTTSLLKQWRRQSRLGPPFKFYLDSILAEQRDDLVTGLVAQGWVSVWARMDAVRVAVGQALARRGGLGGVLSVNGSSCYILGIRGATLYTYEYLVRDPKIGSVMKIVYGRACFPHLRGPVVSTALRSLTNGATAGPYEQADRNDRGGRYFFVTGAGRLCHKLSSRWRLGVLHR